MSTTHEKGAFMRTIKLLLAACLMATSVGANIIPNTADWVDMKAGRSTTGRTLFTSQGQTAQTIEFYGKLSYNFRLYLNYIDYDGIERSCAVQLDPHKSQPRTLARFFEDAPLSGGGGRYITSANILTPFREHEEQYWRFRLDASNPQHIIVHINTGIIDNSGTFVKEGRDSHLFAYAKGYIKSWKSFELIAPTGGRIERSITWIHPGVSYIPGKERHAAKVIADMTANASSLTTQECEQLSDLGVLKNRTYYNYLTDNQKAAVDSALATLHARILGGQTLADFTAKADLIEPEIASMDRDNALNHTSEIWLKNQLGFECLSSSDQTTAQARVDSLRALALARIDILNLTVFKTAADVIEAAIDTMDAAGAEAITTEHLRTTLDYSNLDPSTLTEADIRIAELVSLAQARIPQAHLDFFYAAMDAIEPLISTMDRATAEAHTGFSLRAITGYTLLTDAQKQEVLSRFSAVAQAAYDRIREIDYDVFLASAATYEASIPSMDLATALATTKQTLADSLNFSQLHLHDRKTGSRGDTRLNELVTAVDAHIVALGLGDFTTLADAYEASISSMNLATAQAVTTESLRTELNYNSLPSENRPAANDRISSLLDLVQARIDMIHREAFNTAADALEATISGLSLTQLNAISTSSLQSDLGYSSLATADQAAANTRIAELMVLVEEAKALINFTNAADAFETSIATMDLVTAQAVTESSLQTSLGYANLSPVDQPSADTRIASILALVDAREALLTFNAAADAFESSISGLLLTDLNNVTTTSLRTDLGYANLATADQNSADTRITELLAEVDNAKAVINFTNAADTFEASIPGMDLATAQAVTESSLQTNLGYANLATDDQGAADTRITALLGLVQDRIDVLQLAAFNNAANTLLADLTNQDQATLGAYTESSLQTSLGYANLATDDQATASATIATILARASELASLSPYFTDAGGGSYEAGTLATKQYVYDPSIALDFDGEFTYDASLARKTEVDADNYLSLYYDTNTGAPASAVPGGWGIDFLATGSSRLSFSSLGLFTATNTAFDPVILDGTETPEQAAVQTWNYDPGTVTFSNTHTGHTWDYNPSTKVWTHTVFESDGISSSSFEWTFDHKNATWSNTTTGDTWLKRDVLLWEKTGGSQTPSAGFTEKWMHLPGDHSLFWNNLSQAAYVTSVDVLNTFLLSLDGRTPFSSGVWGEYEDPLFIDDGMTPDITWTWSTSMDSVRGAWVRDDGNIVGVYSYNESEQRWENSGVPGYPPPFLPPFVVEMHNDIVNAYNSLSVQNIVS